MNHEGQEEVVQDSPREGSRWGTSVKGELERQRRGEER